MFYLAHTLISRFAVTCDSNQSFLGLWPWYHYLPLQQQGNTCQINIVPDSAHVLGSHSFILLILLAVVDDLLRIVGFLSVIYVIYAGIRYTMSQGSPDEVAKSQSTIMNALAGLAIALVSIKFVSFLGSKFTTTPGSTSTTLDLTSLPNAGNAVASGNIVQTILSIIFALAGAIAFLYIVIGGFHYVSSQGDPQKVAKAKNTIMYALVGLVVTIMAETIVTVVISKL